MRDGFHFANHCIRLLPVRFFTLLLEPNVLRTSVVFGESFVCDMALSERTLNQSDIV